MRDSSLPDNKRDVLTAQYRAIDKCVRAIGLLHKEARFTADVTNHVAPAGVRKDAEREKAMYAEVIAMLEQRRKQVDL